MNGNALYILDKTHQAILNAEKNELAKTEQQNVEEPFVDIYPCSCGHCPSCGVQVLETATSEELAWLDSNGEESESRWELIDGTWVALW